MQPYKCSFCAGQDYLMEQTLDYKEDCFFSPEEIALEMDTEAKTLSDVSDLVKEITELDSDLI